MPDDFQGLVAVQGGIQNLVDQAVQVKTGEQLGNGVTDRVGRTVGFNAPFHTGHRRLPAAHMAGDNRVGQQLAVNRGLAISVSSG